MKKNWSSPEVLELSLYSTETEHQCCSIVQAANKSIDGTALWYCQTHDKNFYEYEKLVKHLQDVNDKDHHLFPIS